MVTSKNSANERKVTNYGDLVHSLHTTESAELTLLTHEEQYAIHVEQTLDGTLVIRLKTHVDDTDNTESSMAIGLRLYRLTSVLQDAAKKRQTTLHTSFEYRTLPHSGARNPGIPCAIVIKPQQASIVLKILNREKPDKVPDVPQR